MSPTAPLVVTLGLPDPVQERFEGERRTHFPPDRTRVGAHVTLFHALPGALEGEVREVLGGLDEVAAPEVEVRGLRSLGGGVAYDLASPVAERLHAGWQRRWADHLTRQDAQGLRLHVTVQNKVERDVARRTLAILERDFVPFTTHARAVRLWRYDGGPWTHLLDGSFSTPQ